jgi:predicted PurR-regulated permease PerM
MKYIILAEILNRLKDKPDLKKKLKIAAVLGVLSLLVAGTVAIFVGVVGVKYVASLASNINVTQHTEALKSKVENIPAVTSVGCLSAAQSLLSVERLLTTPINTNLQNLKQACFQQTTEMPSEEKKEGALI